MPFYWTEYSIVYLNLLIVTCVVAWLFWKTDYDAEVHRIARAGFFFMGLHTFSQIFVLGLLAAEWFYNIFSGLVAISNIGLFSCGVCINFYFPSLPQTALKTYLWLKRGCIFLFITHALFLLINSQYAIVSNTWTVSNALIGLLIVPYISFGLWHIVVVQKSQNVRWYRALFSLKTLADPRVFAAVATVPVTAFMFYTTYIETVVWDVVILFYLGVGGVTGLALFVLYARTPNRLSLMFLPKLILTCLFGLLIIIATTALGLGYQLRGLYQSSTLLSNPGMVFVDMTAIHQTAPFRAYLHHHIWPLAIVTVVANAGIIIGLRLFLASTLLKPLNELLSAVKEVKSGNLTVALQSSSTDEFGSLSTSFNEMVGALNAAQSEIKQANATLENRVEQRTQELALAKNSAEKANEAKTLFLAKMGHEFRTPLNAIMGFSQLIEQNATNQKHATTIHKNGQHLLSLVDNILDAAQGEAQQIKLQPAAFDLPSTLAHLVQTMSLKAAQKGLTLNYVPKDLPAIIVADAHRLQQVLINLLTNAIKFTDSGSVTLTVETIIWSEAIATIGFAVQDSGRGIATEDLAHIFAPFKQITQKQGTYQKGSGLGLAISQQLVSLMNSKLNVVSTLHEGSTFSFYAEFDFLERQLQPQSRPQLPTPQQIITPKSVSPLLVLPPSDVLKKISAAARIGDVMEIEKQLFPLVATHEQYQPFVQRVEGFLATYQMQSLRNWLTSLAVQTPLGDSAESQIRA